MGNLTPLNLQQQQQTSYLKIDIDLKKPVSDQLKQLTNWSLEEIRQIYVPFRKRKGSPILSRSQFLRFIGLSRITSFYIYDEMKQADNINVLQIMAVLILTAYTTSINKVQFMFNVFDLESNKLIQFKELVLMFTSLIRGYCLLTHQNLPNHTNIQKYAQIMFSRADLNNDQNLQLGQIIGWFQSYSEGVGLFARFQPKYMGKQSYHIFNSFHPYSENQIDIIFYRLNKVYHNEKIQEEDYKILTPIKRNSKLPKFEGFRISKSHHFDAPNFSKQKGLSFLQKSLKMSMTQSKFMESKISYKLSQSSLNQMRRTMIKQQKIKEHPSLSHGRMTQGTRFTPQINQKQNIDPFLKSKIHKRYIKKSFNNIIIIKGRTITKKQVFDLREYFGKISNGKKMLFIEDFLQSFNQDKYNHMKSVAASLYNFLDQKQSGKVSFEQLVLKLYPDLTEHHLKMIREWSQQYNSNFNLDKKVKANRQQEQHKKRVLPKSCLGRFKDIYLLFDKQRKGYVTFQDLKKVLGDVSTQKQLIQTFQECDKDKDGKLNFTQFSHVLLPLDLQIEGLS